MEDQSYDHDKSSTKVQSMKVVNFGIRERGIAGIRFHQSNDDLIQYPKPSNKSHLARIKKVYMRTGWTGIATTLLNFSLTSFVPSGKLCVYRDGEIGINLSLLLQALSMDLYSGPSRFDLEDSNPPKNGESGDGELGSGIIWQKWIIDGISLSGGSTRSLSVLERKSQRNYDRWITQLLHRPGMVSLVGHRSTTFWTANDYQSSSYLELGLGR
ncbi:hypothetical protein BY996DRAFT_6561650 [Phakopsora pachyrhizi]|nr:hypothetical protein BY996DRAFT_6561650 [Phakopsora pachyrhizi]